LPNQVADIFPQAFECVPMHILAVDDSEQILLVVRHALESEGYRVSTAENGAQALAFLASAIPDLILLDVAMPRMDGFEVLERIRGEPRLVGIPVILLTAAGEEAEEQARTLGVEHYLPKPFEIRRLLATVRGTLIRYAQLREAGVAPAPRSSDPLVERPPDILPSGVRPIDRLVGGGGLPVERAYYVTGGIGTGKAVLAIQFVHHALARGEGAVLVTTDRPGVLLRTAEGVGLDLRPHLVSGRLALLELAGNVESLIERVDDLHALTAELVDHAVGVLAKRLVVGSALTLLCGSGRLVLSAMMISAFLRDLEETGLTTLLFGDEPATEEERLADAFLRRGAFGTFRLANVPDKRGLRVLSAERLSCASVDPDGCAYRIVRGHGLVEVDGDAGDVVSPEEIRARIGEVLVRADASPHVLTVDRSGSIRVRDAWDLALRRCLSEAMRNAERCALLVAELRAQSMPEKKRLESCVASLLGTNHMARWVGDGDLVVLGVGSDGRSMEGLAQQIKERVEAVAGQQPGAAAELRCAIGCFSADTLPREGGVGTLRPLEARPHPVSNGDARA
jgi:CheY-like chemotaxis protein/KaiC/GvpD/RAD55 family RecA-like ATPase